MMPLCSAAGAARLDATIRPGVLCVFDFDGTLAPIVARPDQALLPASVRERLQALQRLAPVAILTGRALSDIEDRLQFAADYVVGNHGLEGLPESAHRRTGFRQACNAWKEVLDRALADPARFDPRIAIEDKAISLSVHYRQVADQARAEHALQALFDTLQPAPRVIAGKCVFNLLPLDAGDKGTAFNQLMTLSNATSALYVGDDVTDEDVFRLQRHDLLSVRIGQARDSAAPFFLPRHLDIAPLLDHLIARLDAILNGRVLPVSAAWPPAPGDEARDQR